MVSRVERPLLAARFVELNVPLGALPSENDDHLDGRFSTSAGQKPTGSKPPHCSRSLAS